ncbi:MAG: endonuclease III [Oscillospiraceae bacterium]|nr:endonuclease III [Oscillospiraceae bacterium]
MELQEKALKIVEILEEIYPGAQCSLEYTKPHELLIATRLSAQCTDARVNMVTGALFERFPTIEDFARATPEEVEPYIRSCGLYHTKARDIVALAKALVENYGGQVPATLEELTALPGVGRKTANLIMGDVYHQPAVVTDTHCIRICRRLGLTTSDNPLKTEMELRAILPMDRASDFCHRLVNFGRETCVARKPRCEGCPLKGYCETNGRSTQM